MGWVARYGNVQRQRVLIATVAKKAEKIKRNIYPNLMW